MLSRVFLFVLVVCLCLSWSVAQGPAPAATASTQPGAAPGGAFTANGFNDLGDIYHENLVSTMYTPEVHHSLSQPFDKSQVYWNFGGSTVVTKNLIRLTPSTQDRKGWLWNEYPLESPHWEVEFKLEIFSKPHFGGDGFAFWILAGEQDPSFTQNPEALTGPLFGMKNDFQGFGLIFDVYDNDNRRNNPSVFVLKNPKGGMTNYNHDNDYEDDMVRTPPQGVDLTNNAYKCVADVRNTGKPAKILVKFLHKNLHVYIDNNEGLGYKFCLAVRLEEEFKDHHIAFTAATGQVADNHDIVEITTRYLKATDQEFDDTQLEHLGTAGVVHHHSLGMLFCLVLTVLSAFVLFIAANQIYSFHSLSAARIDLVQICAKLNQHVLHHYGAHAVLTLLLLLGGHYWFFLLNLPLAAWRGYEFSKKNFLFSPSSIGPAKGHAGNAKINIYAKLGGAVALYTIMEFYFLFKLFF